MPLTGIRHGNANNNRRKYMNFLDYYWLPLHFVHGDQQADLLVGLENLQGLGSK